MPRSMPTFQSLTVRSFVASRHRERFGRAHHLTLLIFSPISRLCSTSNCARVRCTSRGGDQRNARVLGFKLHPAGLMNSSGSIGGSPPARGSGTPSRSCTSAAARRRGPCAPARRGAVPRLRRPSGRGSRARRGRRRPGTRRGRRTRWPRFRPLPHAHDEASVSSRAEHSLLTL